MVDCSWNMIYNWPHIFLLFFLMVNFVKTVFVLRLVCWNMIWYIVLRVRYTDVCIISLMQKNNDQKIGMDINEYVWNSSYELKSRTVK